MIILSILIPTRNRPLELKFLIDSLTNLIEQTKTADKIEILISDNSDDQSEIFGPSNLQVLRPDKPFSSAEDNLFFLLSKAIGKYVWPLGDDDIPNIRAFEKLINICEIGEIDAMNWNSRILGVYGELIGHSRVVTDEEIIRMEYADFLLRMGYWSIPAAISLTVFKNELNNFNSMDDIKALDSPIYSHVAYYAAIFKDSHFAFINEILVDYQTNQHDVLKKSQNHWKNYSKNQKKFYRYPWTLGTVKQLKYLETIGAIKKHYLFQALDISHFNKRFRLVDQIVLMLFDQLLKELTDKKIRKISLDELREIISYISLSEPRFSRYFELFMEIKTFPKKNISNHLFEKLENQHIFFKRSLERLPFHSYYRNYRFGFLIYETPLGWLGIKPDSELINNTLIKNNSKEYVLIEDLASSLLYALNGIKIPPYFQYHAQTEVELLEILAKEVSTSNANYIIFNSLRESTAFYGYAVHQNHSRARTIWNRTPLFIKKYLLKNFF